MVNELPFEEIVISTGATDTVIRKYSSEFDSEEFKWHWDEEDRTIHSINETDWMFQFDNELPIRFDGKLEIKKGVWHRLIKGNSDVRIKIKK